MGSEMQPTQAAGDNRQVLADEGATLARPADTLDLVEVKRLVEPDVLLRVDVDHEPDRPNMLPTASALDAVAAMDAVAICVMQHNGFDAGQFSVIHPDGARPMPGGTTSYQK